MNGRTGKHPVSTTNGTGSRAQLFSFEDLIKAAISSVKNLSKHESLHGLVTAKDAGLNGSRG